MDNEDEEDGNNKDEDDGNDYDKLDASALLWTWSIMVVGGGCIGKRARQSRITHCSALLCSAMMAMTKMKRMAMTKTNWRQVHCSGHGQS